MAGAHPKRMLCSGPRNFVHERCTTKWTPDVFDSCLPPSMIAARVNLGSEANEVGIAFTCKFPLTYATFPSCRVCEYDIAYRLASRALQPATHAVFYM